MTYIGTSPKQELDTKAIGKEVQHIKAAQILFKETFRPLTNAEHCKKYVGDPKSEKREQYNATRNFKRKLKRCADILQNRKTA